MIRDFAFFIQPLPREAEDFLRGDTHFKHVPLLTYLTYLSPKAYYLVGSTEGLKLASEP